MMFKIVAIWGDVKPDDAAAFEAYYHDVHVPLARKVPGLRDLQLVRTDKGLEGGAAGFYRLAVLAFDSEAAMHQSAQSPEWTAMRQDAATMIERFGCSLSVGTGADG
jgi:uncharacterized protein (TIGR02118 family)